MIKYPHLLIPAVPEHNSQSKIDDNQISKKMELLEAYMNKLIQNDDIKACPQVLDFLQMRGQKEHSKQLKTE